MPNGSLQEKDPPSVNICLEIFMGNGYIQHCVSLIAPDRCDEPPGLRFATGTEGRDWGRGSRLY
jgi:hypothetical protein